MCTHSADDPTPARTRLNVVREPTPARLEDVFEPETVADGTLIRLAEALQIRSVRRGAGMLAGCPFVSRAIFAHCLTACAVDLGATDPITFADRSETFSTTALRVPPKFKLLPPR